ncbi:hypothetical protein [Maribacter sp. 4G9]|uniref:hypothetical protein n=1 Tax=Maribacter sp. 4G9 TaxID=1889777 RepID=UPI000C16151C|nr:hypothetical protein [Maribacter sp. 4G9]PIB28131.1 hypothetical protein BFP75_05320 [Maribacter sp. 4G9]
MQINKKTVLPLLGVLAMILLIGLSYFNQFIFMEQLLLCAFIFGLSALVHILGGMKNIGQEEERAKEGIK